MYRSAFEVDHILQRLARTYRGDSYDLVRCNCNHFSNVLSKTLVGKQIPAYVNRTANVGKGILGVFSLPSQALGGLLTGIKKVQKGKGYTSASSNTPPPPNTHTRTHTHTPAASSPTGPLISNEPVASPATKSWAPSPFSKAYDLRAVHREAGAGQTEKRASDEIPF